MSKNNKQKVMPRGKYMLVEVEPPADYENPNGIIVPANSDKEQKAQGVVLQVGDEVKPDIKKGDVIIFGAYAGETLTMTEGKEEIEYKLLHDDDVIAKIV